MEANLLNPNPQTPDPKFQIVYPKLGDARKEEALDPQPEIPSHSLILAGGDAWKEDERSSLYDVRHIQDRLKGMEKASTSLVP